jgi:5'-3' exonuclease
VVSPSTSILLQINGGIEGWPVVTGADVLSRFGVTPRQYLDFAVLRGDPSDGLPGVSGIGDKTGATLISHFGDLEALIAAAGAPNAKKPLTPRLCSKLLESQDYLARARQVITAEVGLPVNAWDFDIPSSPADEPALASLSQNWGVERFVSELYQSISGKL